MITDIVDSARSISAEDMQFLQTSFWITLHPFWIKGRVAPDLDLLIAEDAQKEIPITFYFRYVLELQRYANVYTDVFPLSYSYVITYLTDYFGEVLIPKVSRWETLAHVVLIRDDAELIDSFFIQRTARGWLEDLSWNRFVFTLPWRGVDLGGPWRGADLRGRAFWENRHWKFFF